MVTVNAFFVAWTTVTVPAGRRNPVFDRSALNEYWPEVQQPTVPAVAYGAAAKVRVSNKHKITGFRRIVRPPEHWETSQSHRAFSFGFNKVEIRSREGGFTGSRVFALDQLTRIKDLTFPNSS